MGIRTAITTLIGKALGSLAVGIAVVISRIANGGWEDDSW